MLPAPFDQMARPVDKQVAQLEGIGFRRPGRTALQHFLHAQHQLARAEGFGDVILRPEFQADDSVHLGRFSGQHDDGNTGGRLVPPQHLADLQSIDFGQHQIEHNQTREGRAGLLKRLGTVFGADDVEPCLLEVKFEQLYRLRFIIDNEDLRSHTSLGYHECRVTTMASL